MFIGLFSSTAVFAQSLDCTVALSNGQRIACEKLNSLELATDTDTGRVAVDLLEIQLAVIQIRLEQATLDQHHLGSFILNEVGVHIGEVKQLLETLKNPRVDLDAVFKKVAAQIESLKSVFKGEQ